MADHRRLRPLGFLAGIIALLVGLGAWLAPGRAAEEERGILADVISRVLSTPASRVSIGRIDGALSSSATIYDIAVADRDGVWLKLDRARIIWRRLALIQRRLEVDDLDLGQLTVLRRPVPAEVPVKGEEQPLLPALPVKLDVKQFALAEMIVGQPILGFPARFSMGGYGTLGAPSEGLVLHVDAQRLDRVASLTARLTLVPDTQRLTVAVNLDEQAGGLVSTLGGIPGEPPVKLALEGDGTLDAFASRLDFTAGPDVGANGTATVRREAAGRRLGLDLGARIGGFVPAVAAPVLAGTTTLKGDVLFGDDHAVKIGRIGLDAAAARVDITGSIDPDGVANIGLKARNVTNADGRTALGDAAFRDLDLDAHLTGAVSAPTVRATLTVADARLPAGSVTRLGAHFTATPTDALGAADARLRVEAAAQLDGLAFANPALARALGSTARLSLQGTTGTLGGTADIAALDLQSETLRLSYTGRVGSAELAGHLRADLPDLSRFGDVAGLDLRGAATLAAEVGGTPRANRFTAVLDAKTTDLRTGEAAIDGLFGGALVLAGGLRLDPDGGLGFDHVRLTGPHATATVDGDATPAKADVTAAFEIPDLARADSRLSGRGEGFAHITGTLDHPDGTVNVALRNGALMGRPVPLLGLAVEATDLRGQPEARLRLDGTIDRKPARAALHLRRGADGSLTLDGLDALVGTVTAKGGLTLDRDAIADGQLSVTAGNLDDLSPLALQTLAGSLAAEVGLTRTDGKQGATLKARGSDIRAAGMSLRRLLADLSVTDLTHRPVVNGVATIDEAEVGGQTVSGLRLDAKGTPAGSDVTFKAMAGGVALAAAARVVPADPVRIELSRFEATRGSVRAALAAPGTLVLANGGLDLRNIAVTTGRGRVSADGHVGPQLRLKVLAQAVPLAAADLAVSGLGAAGTLDAEIDLRGAAKAPDGTYRLSVAGLSLPQGRSANMPPLAIKATGRLGGGRATIDAQAQAAGAGALSARGSLPLDPTGALDLAVTGQLDAALANRVIAAGGRSLTGSVAVDGRLAGPLAHPRASGSVTLAHGAFSDAVNGVRLDDITVRLRANDGVLTIAQATATTRNGGPLSASGTVRLDAGAGFPASIHIGATGARALQTALAAAVLDLDLTVTGPLLRDPRLGGRIAIASLDVTVPERLPGQDRPLPGTRHLRPTPTAARRLALEAKPRRSASTFAPRLDLTVSVPGWIRVHGRGLDAQLGGGLRLTGTLAQPKPVGSFNLVQGRLQVLTASLDFTRANLTFAGDLTPSLDFMATTRAGGAAISISVTGQPDNPAFTFASSPELPQDEILSRLLFGAPAGELSTGQALSLAAAAAQYAPGGGGAMEALRRSLGLGENLLSSNPLTRALGNRVSIGVHTGATPADTGVGADVSVIGPLKARGSVDANGGTSLGLGAEHEW